LDKAECTLAEQKYDCEDAGSKSKHYLGFIPPERSEGGSLEKLDLFFVWGLKEK